MYILNFFKQGWVHKPIETKFIFKLLLHIKTKLAYDNTQPTILMEISSFYY